jgi:outer membrane biosynthesis protein TonB
MDTSFSSFTYTGVICYITDDGVFEPFENAEEIEDPDVETPKIPWKVFDKDGNELSTNVNRYYRQYGEWEDLYSTGVYSYEGLIISLPSTINDYIEPEIPEEPEDPKEDPEIPVEDPKEDPEDPKEDPEQPVEDPEEEPDDKKYIPYGGVDPEKETDPEENDDALPSANMDVSEKGASSDKLSLDTYTILILTLIVVLVGLIGVTGYMAYRKFK